VTRPTAAAPAWRCACTGAAGAGALALLAIGLLRWRFPWFLQPAWLAALLLLLPAGLLGAAIAWRLRRAVAVAPWLLPVVLLAAGAVLALPSPDVRGLRMLVVVIDGATWHLIDPMIAAGELPALAALRRGGASAVLRSEEPMHSPRLWTTIATGRRPAEHGITGFSTRATDLRAARFWDVAEAEGLRVGIYKWLVTYPPRAVDGFMVPSWLAAGPETWPPELSFVKELELGHRLRHVRVPARRSALVLALRGLDGGLRLGTLAEAAGWLLRDRLLHPEEGARLIALQHLRARIDRDVCIGALAAQRPAVATFGYYATDALSHRFWPDDAPATGRDPVREACRQADAILGELVALAGPGATVVVVSDHGFRALDAATGSGFLAPRTEALQARLIRALGPLEVTRVGGKLTVTLPATGPCLEDLEEAVAALRDGAGESFFRTERLPSDPRSLGLTIDRARLSEAGIASATVGGEPMADYVRLAAGYAGEHDLEGIFLAMGPGIPAGLRLDPMDLVDVSPTIQALLGIPPAQDLSGRIVLGPATRGPASRDGLLARHRFVAGEAGVDEEALRGVGYVE
jgi:hypothetical protein